MTQSDTTSKFKAKLLRPAKSDGDASWAFVLVPKSASEKLPRRGRTTVDGTIEGHAFQVTLEPDGQLSHWMRLDNELLEAAGVKVGDRVAFELTAVEQEPEPEAPLT